MALSRRQFLQSSGAVGAGIAFAGATDVLLTSGHALAATGPGYGPLVRDPRGLLDLPEGFSYRIVQRAGRPLLDGSGVTPGGMDGTATFNGPGGSNYLVVNHELDTEEDFPVRAAAACTYDPVAEGGTTTLHVAADRTTRSQYVSLAGTVRNCAGGRTPWGTWLTCEETEDRFEKSHGWVFEVEPRNARNNLEPTPLRALGRFAHEALAIDPDTGVVYLTEDASDPFGLVYRHLPQRPLGGLHSLRAGGALQAMHVPGVPDLSEVTAVGTTLRNVQWRDVPDRDASNTSTRMQLSQVTRSQKLEGAWWGRGAFYFVSSYSRVEDGGAKSHNGQVWRYEPAGRTLTLELQFAADQTRFDGPDNISVTPNGGILLAEDGEGEQHIVGFDPKTNTAFKFAHNRIDNRDPDAPEDEPPSFAEMTGPVFSMDGSTLFFNVQEPGITYAVKGPWQQGAL